jgi:hypothetical protein
MKRLLFGLMLFAAPMRAEDLTTVSVIVPVVASTIGPLDTHWKTDVILQNDLKTEMTVTLSLPTVPDQPIILLTLPAGRTQRFTDVVGEAFALDNVISPLVVQTLGRHSVRVAASAYAVQGGTITRPQPIPLTDPSSFYPLRTLQSLAHSPTRRTNLGLINLGEREAVFTLALKSAAGDTVGAVRSVLPPNTMWHIALQLLFPSMKEGEGYAILAETGARDTYVYASVVDNTTNQAEFIAPSVGSH